MCKVKHNEFSKLSVISIDVSLREYLSKFKDNEILKIVMLLAYIVTKKTLSIRN